MASIWIGIVIGACLLLQQQEILAQMVYPNCGLVAAQDRIIGGKAASLGSAPFMAYLMKNNTLHCGGSIINKRYILTAASCVSRDLTVRLGEYDDTMDPDCIENICMPRHEDFEISKIAYHKNYNTFTQANDIALIRLNSTIQFKVHIQPICLHQYPVNATKPNEYQVFGWGVTSRYGSESHTLQTTTLRQNPNTYCSNQFRRELTQNQICAGSQGSDTCNGDSGSPLVTHGRYNNLTRYVQMGIVSYGHHKCIGVGVYTNVPNYGTWIMNMMRRLNKLK